MDKNTQQQAPWEYFDGTWHVGVDGERENYEMFGYPTRDLYTAPPVPRDVLMAFGEAVRDSCSFAVSGDIGVRSADKVMAGVDIAALADRYASQVQPELPSFDDVIAVQRREVMANPSDAYMVGLYNGMTMMDANYRNSTDFECLTVQKQPEPVNQQMLAALKRLKCEVILSDVDMDYIELHFRPHLDVAEAAIAAAEGIMPNVYSIAAAEKEQGHD